MAVKPVLESLEGRRLLASAGDLNLGFSGDGFDEQFGPGGQASSVAVQSDGKIVVVGLVDGVVAVARYEADGDLDTTFVGGGQAVSAGAGLVTIPTVTSDSAALPDVVIRNDGNIFVAGTTAAGGFFGISLDADGSIDADVNDEFIFSDDSATNILAGAVVSNNGTADVSDDYVYVAGRNVGLEDDGLFVARFTNTGLDTTFAGAPGGVQVILNGPAIPSTTGVAITSDLDIIVASDSAVTRINSDGTLDAGFGFNGTYEHESVDYGFQFTDVAVDSNDDIYVAGSLVDLDDSDQAIFVLKLDGSGNAAIGFDANASRTYVAAGDTPVVESITIDSDGPNGDRVVVAGSIVSPTFDLDVAVSRFDAGSGAPDAGFGTDGLVIATPPDRDAQGYGVAIAGGNIVVVGQSSGDNAFLTLQILSEDEIVTPPVFPVSVDGNGNLVIGDDNADAATSVQITLVGSQLQVTYNGENAGLHTVTGDIQITLLGGNDTVTIGEGVTADADIVTGAGSDTVNAGVGNDTISGELGDDVINGGGGADLLNGGDGHDLASGGAGNDTLNGGDGNDSLNGDGNSDLIQGGNGDDFAKGGSGNDLILGQEGSDIVLGGSGSDFLSGGNGRDLLAGGDGADAMSGDGGEDILIGGSVTLSDSQLAQVRTEWNGTGSYSSRVASLQGGAGPNLVSEVNVFDDGSMDILSGGAASDWFLFNNDHGPLTRDLILDRTGGEVRTDID